MSVRAASQSPTERVTAVDTGTVRGCSSGSARTRVPRRKDPRTACTATRNRADLSTTGPHVSKRLPSPEFSRRSVGWSRRSLSSIRASRCKPRRSSQASEASLPPSSVRPSDAIAASSSARVNARARAFSSSVAGVSSVELAAERSEPAADRSELGRRAREPWREVA